MTDDDIAELIAVELEVTATPLVLEAIKCSQHFRSVKAQMLRTELSVNIEQLRPRWLRALVRRWAER